MSLPPDRIDDMIETVRDIEISDRLLSGDISLDELPDGYSRLVELVAAARAEATPAELAHEAAVVAAIAAATTATAIGQSPLGRSRAVRLLGAKAAIVATLALTATGAAAATNHLPGPAQSAISNVASAFGIDISSGDDAPTTDTSTNSDAGKPTSQPGASAGEDGNDSRPDCAGNPSSDKIGRASCRERV